MKRPRRLWPIVLLAALIEALAPASGFIQPVVGAGRHDWNPASFWHGNWGVSGMHKGIDIFARTGTPVVAAQSGRVLYTGTLSLGGNVVLVITPRGWLQYYAHLNRIDARPRPLARSRRAGRHGRRHRRRRRAAGAPALFGTHADSAAMGFPAE